MSPLFVYSSTTSKLAVWASLAFSAYVFLSIRYSFITAFILVGAAFLSLRFFWRTSLLSCYRSLHHHGNQASSYGEKGFIACFLDDSSVYCDQSIQFTSGVTSSDGFSSYVLLSQWCSDECYEFLPVPSAVLCLRVVVGLSGLMLLDWNSLSSFLFSIEVADCKLRYLLCCCIVCLFCMSQCSVCPPCWGFKDPFH